MVDNLGRRDSADAARSSIASSRWRRRQPSGRGKLADFSAGLYPDAASSSFGFRWPKKLYCAHSNYPQKPERSEIMVLDPVTMALTPFKEFGQYRGSLTWVVREGDFWWCSFAHYGSENAQTALVKLDATWNKQGAWTLSARSGQRARPLQHFRWGVEGRPPACHDRRVIYRLRLLERGTQLQWVDGLPSPLPGQGFAADPGTGGFVGVDRAKGSVVFAEVRN